MGISPKQIFHALKKLRILLAIMINAFISWQVYLGHSFFLMPYLWVVSIFLLIFSELKFKQFSKHSLKNKSELALILLLVLIAIVVIVLNYNHFRYHGDDLITAYFSSKQSFIGKLFFNPVPQNPGDWVCQFPSLYFVIQKFLLMFLGHSNLAVKLSVLPYQIIIVIFLYKILKEIFSKEAAFWGIFFYIFLAISLYFTTLGLHFISSTAMYTVSLYFCINYFKKPQFKTAVILGICAALAMLFYTSSYLVPIFIGLMLIFVFIRKPRRMIVRDGLVIVILFFTILAPFITVMYKNSNWYFLQRYEQVKIIDGEWSSQKSQDKKTLKEKLTVYQNNFNLSFNSLHTRGIGGHGGYNFGHLAFFDGFTLTLLFFAIGLTFHYPKRYFLVLFVVVTIIITFIAGMVLTIPPPPFHRLTLILPGLAIVFTVLLDVWQRKFPYKQSERILLLGLMVIYCLVNFRYFRKSVSQELNPPEIEVIKEIKNNYPGRTFYIATFPGYALEKNCYFFENCYSKKIVTDYHVNILKRSDEIKTEKYVIYMTFAAEFQEQFQTALPGANILLLEGNRAIIWN